MRLAGSLLEDVVKDVLHCLLMDPEIGSKFELGHFFDFEPAHYSHDLEESFLASFDWLLDGKSFILDPIFDIGL